MEILQCNNEHCQLKILHKDTTELYNRLLGYHYHHNGEVGVGGMAECKTNSYMSVFFLDMVCMCV